MQVKWQINAHNGIILICRQAFIQQKVKNIYIIRHPSAAHGMPAKPQNEAGG